MVDGQLSSDAAAILTLSYVSRELEKVTSELRQEVNVMKDPRIVQLERQSALMQQSLDRIDKWTSFLIKAVIGQILTMIGAGIVYLVSHNGHP